MSVGPSWPRGSFLERLDATTRLEAGRLGARREFAPRQQLVVQGDTTDNVMVIVFGVVKVTACLSSGHETLLSIRRSGDVIGELAAIDGSPRSATVVTCGRVVVRDVSAAKWHTFLERHPTAWRALNVMMADRLRTATRRRVELGGCSAAVRVARLLVELVHRFGDDEGDGGLRLGLALSQAEIAAAAGCGDASARQALADLRERQIVSTSYRSLIVHDLPALLRYADVDPD